MRLLRLTSVNPLEYAKHAVAQFSLLKTYSSRIAIHERFLKLRVDYKSCVIESRADCGRTLESILVDPGADFN